MIKSFRDKETERVFNRHFSSKLPQSIQRIARKKLVILDAAPGLNDLRIPPGNQLEALKRDRKGQHSIRINDQWRICFKWRAGDAYDVEITPMLHKKYGKES
ncbi:MAG: type II toxin-antitoxin system RelE/ParE family toxin [Thermodesulfobacteriota bacterium]|nr:type II toxin-antitoxin system RelE/ParE family toxin [Thermodesulfobacteriota bacterium]